MSLVGPPFGPHHWRRYGRAVFDRQRGRWHAFGSCDPDFRAWIPLGTFAAEGDARSALQEFVSAAS